MAFENRTSACGTIEISGNKESQLRKLPSKLTETSHPARLWSSMENGRVQCHLSPRNCKIPNGGLGFCGVRYNDNGKLVTLNYGKSVQATQETIETEAVFHYAPGAKILSMGNIGCMLHCDYCQNYQTSQARLAQNKDIYFYTPEQIVEYALKHKIHVLSWTYNDPVVWQEFVVDTSRLAKAHGIKNLYKSAFYITLPAIDELLEVIDIFSISLKSMDPHFYTKHTQGKLQPVLDGIKHVYKSKKHLEISNLCVTGRNDNLVEAGKLSQWMIENLDAEVPLHYVRFHPDYKYTQAERTSIPFLEEARLQALQHGLKYVYLGNVSGTSSVNTYCECGEVLTTRFGLNAVLNLNQGHCPSCKKKSPLTLPEFGLAISEATLSELSHHSSMDHLWRGAVQAVHIEQTEEKKIAYQFIDSAGAGIGSILTSSCNRFIISKGYLNSVGVRIWFEPGSQPRVLEVYDRAHFPVFDITQSDLTGDQTPAAKSG